MADQRTFALHCLEEGLNESLQEGLLQPEHNSKQPGMRSNMGQKQASRQKGLKRSDERSHDEYAVLKEQLRERDSTIARLETDLANSIDVILDLRKSPDCPDNATLRKELESLLYQITRWATITFVKSKIGEVPDSRST